MNKLTLDCLMEVLRDASNDKNTLVHIATDLGLSSTHPGILTDKIRKMKAKAEAYETTQEDFAILGKRLRDIREVLDIGSEVDTLEYIKSLPKMEPKKSMTELHAVIVIDNLIKENLNLKLENAKLEFEILVHKKNQGK